jgi:hypothetical protein
MSEICGERMDPSCDSHVIRSEILPSQIGPRESDAR